PIIKLTNSAILTSGFENLSSENTQNAFTSTLKISDISSFTLRSAINKIDFFHFSNLKKHFPHLKSINEFLADENYLGKIIWSIYSDIEKPLISEYQKRKAVMDVLEWIKKGVLKNDCDYEGTKEFYPIPLKTRLEDKTLKVKPKPNANGLKKYEKPFDVMHVDWYVYDENYGTSEEMDFVLFLNAQIENLNKKFEDIRLIRNEKAFWLYSFRENGQRFEPDFILLLTTKNENKALLQVFIEPKGEHLRLGDAWKENFLLSLHEATVCKKNIGLLVDCEDIKIFGLPFYNHQRENEFLEDWKTAFLEK
ncbi:hypothetical protein JWV37_11435, partial [Sulfurospirillum sp. T05]|nr:hypothetical protein [Sulfurospirillum tamanensis]